VFLEREKGFNPLLEREQVGENFGELWKVEEM